MPITEPITMLTDYAIAIVAGIFAISLLHQNRSDRQVSIGFWAAAFAFVAIAAGLGGTCHGFVLGLSRAWSRMLWQLMVYSLSLASFCLIVGTIFSSTKHLRQVLLAAAIARSAVIWIHLLQLPRFSVAATDYGMALLIVLLLQLIYPTPATQWLLAGILVSGLAIGVLLSGMRLFELNPNDLYHLVQLIGLGLFYQGAKQLRDR